MTVYNYPAGTSLAEALTDLYSKITTDWVGIPLESISNEVLSGNPTATFSRIMELTFQSGTSIESVGLINFVSDFIDAVAGGETLADPFEDLSRQLPSTGYYSKWTLENGISVLPLNTRLVFEGDSITAGSNGPTYIQMASQYVDGRYFLTDGYNQGVGGQSSAQALADIATTLAENPEMCVVYLGVNDLIGTSDDAATIQGNLRAIYDALIGAGSRVVAVKIYELGVGVLTAPREAVRVAVNAWMDTQADVTVVDTATINPVTDMSDGIHPNYIGAGKLGDLIGAGLDLNIATGDILSGYLTSSNSIFANSDNAELSGTGGSKSGGGTGDVADQWVGADNTDATVVYSKSTLNGAEAQRIQITGTNTLDNAVVVFRQDLTWIVDTEEYWAAIDTLAASVDGVESISVSFEGLSPNSGINSGQYPTTFSNVMRTDNVEVTGSPSSTRFQVVIKLANSAVNVDVTLARPVVVKSN